jgi:hypothetical protein
MVDKKRPIDPDTWKKAVSQVNKAFNATPPTLDVDVDIAADRMKQDESLVDSLMYPAIGIVADKMKKGIKPEGAQETRIAYALMTAYLDQSGELDKLVAQQKEAAKDQKHAAANVTDPYALAAKHAAVVAAMMTAQSAYPQSLAKPAIKDGQTQSK